MISSSPFSLFYVIWRHCSELSRKGHLLCNGYPYFFLPSSSLFHDLSRSVAATFSILFTLHTVLRSSPGREPSDSTIFLLENVCMIARANLFNLESYSRYECLMKPRNYWALTISIKAAIHYTVSSLLSPFLKENHFDLSFIRDYASAALN